MVLIPATQGKAAAFDEALLDNVHRKGDTQINRSHVFGFFCLWNYLNIFQSATILL